MKLVLVRHGRPDEHHPERPHDPPLSDEGWRQARAVGALLAREGVTRIVSSPLLRARQTSEPLAASLGLRTEIVDGWAEADRNVARYRSGETLRALGEAQWQRFLSDPVSYLGGDPVRFRADVLDAFSTTVGSAGEDDRIAVFTHGLPINLVLSHLLGLDCLVRFHPGFASVTRLNARGAAFDVVSINERGHHAWPQSETT